MGSPYSHEKPKEEPFLIKRTSQSSSSSSSSSPSSSSTSEINRVMQENRDLKIRYNLLLKEKENMQGDYNKLINVYKNLEVDFKLLGRERDRYKDLYYEQGNLNTMSLIYVISSFLIFIIFVVYISIKACESMKKKPKTKKLNENLISKP